jgi:hypothetical protein
MAGARRAHRIRIALLAKYNRQKLIPDRQTAFILSAALLIEGVVDRGVG